MKPEDFLKTIEAGVEIELPSGLEVTVRPIDATALLTMDFPDALMASIKEYVLGKNADADPSQEDMLDTIKKTRELGEIVAETTIIKPRIVREDRSLLPGEFPASKLPDNDLRTLLMALNVPLVYLQSFFRKQAKDLVAVYVGAIDQPVPVAGDGTGRDDAPVDGAPQPLSAVPELVVD